MTIVFVCTGNTCRSPMAEVLFERLTAGGTPTFRALSAGIHAVEGASAAQSAVEVMSGRGLDLRGHRATLLSEEIVDQADLLLTMTEAQRDFILQQYPDAATKTFLLSRFAGAEGDVQDPFGAGPEVYAKTAEELVPLLKAVASKLMKRHHNGAAPM